MWSRAEAALWLSRFFGAGATDAKDWEPTAFVDAHKAWLIAGNPARVTHVGDPASITSEVTLKDHSIVVVSDVRVPTEWHGTWFSPSFDWKKGSGRFAEMITGRAHIKDITREQAAAELKLRHATEDEWAFVIGLVVCEMAERKDF